VAWAVNVRVVTGRGFVLDVGGVDGNAACFFFWSSVDLVVSFRFAAEGPMPQVAIAAVRVVLPWST
jgi:hypothetical protein